jgi:bifunctional non-homologous end joining protein LigD
VTEQVLDVEGRAVHVSSLDRVLWSETGTTKADLLEYYVSVSPVLLPHLTRHPVTLHRFPEGVAGPHFFQTRTPPHPSWLPTVTLSYARTGKSFETPVIDDLPSLVWAANLSAIELHPFLGRVGALESPTALVLDLDPGAPAGLREAGRVALLLREVLERQGLAAYPKSSGGKGIHLHVPLLSVTYEQTKGMARQLAAALAATHPDLVVDRMAKTLRAGRVLVDWSQNDPGKSTVAPWSVRGYAIPTVAAPLTWHEVEATANGRPLLVSISDVPRRLDLHGDLFADVAHPRHTL